MTAFLGLILGLALATGLQLGVSLAIKRGNARTEAHARFLAAMEAALAGVSRQPHEGPNEAAQRAEALLMSLLDDRQAEDWRTGGSFDEKTPSGRLVRLQRASLALELDPVTRQIVRWWCIHAKVWPFYVDGFDFDPFSSLPDCDDLVAQLLHLRYDEATFWRLAHPGTLF